MSTQVRNTRDFYLENLTLRTAVTTVDIRLTSIEISYQEDIFKNSCHGYVMMAEGAGYVESLKLSGGETLQLILGKTGSSDKITKNFTVYKIDKRKSTGNRQSESYLLYFCTREMIYSERVKVNTSYSEPISITDIVSDICETYLGTSIVRSRNTYGNYNFVIPNLTPFDAINWLSNYARPEPPYVGADFVFFENKDGFNFLPLQAMINPGSSDCKEYGQYSFNPSNIDTKDFQMQSQTALTYEILSSYDTLRGLASGAFANRLISVDILTRKKKETKFNYLDYFEEVGGSGAILNDYAIKAPSFDVGDPMLKMVFSNFDQENNSVVQARPGSVATNINAETYIPYRTAQLSLINYQRIKLSVPGDPNLSVGYVTRFFLQSKNPGQTEQDAYYSGRFLITAIRHLITQSSYTTVMEIAKESVTEPYKDPV